MKLVDHIGFTDLGVNSLLSVAISGRFREELGLEVHSLLFICFPSIGVDDHSLSFGVENVEMNRYLILARGTQVNDYFGSSGRL